MDQIGPSESKDSMIVSIEVVVLNERHQLVVPQDPRSLAAFHLVHRASSGSAFASASTIDRRSEFLIDRGLLRAERVESDGRMEPLGMDRVEEYTTIDLDR